MPETANAPATRQAITQALGIRDDQLEFVPSMHVFRCRCGECGNLIIPGYMLVEHPDLLASVVNQHNKIKADRVLDQFVGNARPLRRRTSAAGGSVVRASEFTLEELEKAIQRAREESGHAPQAIMLSRDQMGQLRQILSTSFPQGQEFSNPACTITYQGVPIVETRGL